MTVLPLLLVLAQTQHPRLICLAMGVDSLADGGLPALSTPVPNARGFASTILKGGGVSSVLLNPTWAQAAGALSRLAEQCASGDVFVLYFSGYKQGSSWLFADSRPARGESDQRMPALIADWAKRLYTRKAGQAVIFDDTSDLDAKPQGTGEISDAPLLLNDKDQKSLGVTVLSARKPFGASRGGPSSSSPQGTRAMCTALLKLEPNESFRSLFQRFDGEAAGLGDDGRRTLSGDADSVALAGLFQPPPPPPPPSVVGYPDGKHRLSIAWPQLSTVRWVTDTCDRIVAEGPTRWARISKDADVIVQFPTDATGRTVRTSRAQLVEARSGGVIGYFDQDQPLDQRVVEAREALTNLAKWRSIDALRDDGDDKVEVRVVPALVRPEGQYFRFDRQAPQTASETVYGHVGDYFAIQVRASKGWAPYMSILDLTPDAKVSVLWPNRGDPEQHRWPDDGEWHYLTTTGAPSKRSVDVDVFRTTEPFGREVLKVMATNSLPDFRFWETGFEKSALGQFLSRLADKAAQAPSPTSTAPKARWACAQATYYIRPKLRHPAHVCLISVGTNQIDEKSHHVSNLRGAVNDATTLHTAIRTLWGSEVLPDSLSILLTDRNATKEAILDAIVKTARRLDPSDLLILTFSGMGTEGPSGSTPVMYPYGCDFTKPETLITLLELKEALATCPASNQFVFLDTCHMVEKEGVSRLFGELAAPGSTGGALIVGLAGETPDFGETASLRLAKILGNPTNDLDGDHCFSASEIRTAVEGPQGRTTDPRFASLHAYFYGADFAIAPAPSSLQSWGMERRAHRRALSQDPTRSKDGKPASPDPQRRRNGKDYALIIATDDYDGKPAWPHLDNPTVDARNLKKVLEDDYGFEVQPILLDPSYDQIQAAIESYTDSKTYPPADDDQLMIFIAGHGDDVAKWNQAYVVLKESKDPDNDKSHRTYLAATELFKWADREDIPFKHVMLVLDVCAGTQFLDSLTIRKPASGGSVMAFVRRKQDQRLKDALYRLKKRSRLVLVSCDEKAKDGHAGSPFANSMIKALSDGVGSGLVDFDQIWNQVKILDQHPDWGGMESRDFSDGFQFLSKQAKARLSQGSTAQMPAAAPAKPGGHQRHA